MQTREPKSGEAPLERSVATWAETDADLGFDRRTAARLRNGGGFHGSPGSRRVTVADAIRARASDKLSLGERRAVAYECAAGRLRLDEVEVLLSA